MNSIRFRAKKNTAANWTSQNPVLKANTWGIETDTGELKFGDGSTTWANLPYVAESSAKTTTGTGSAVCATSPTLVTPILGVAAATTVSAGAGTVSAPAFTFTGDPDTGIIDSAANSIGFVTAGAEQWIINASGALNPITDNTKDIGSAALAPRNIRATTALIKRGVDSTTGYGELSVKSISASKTLTNARTNTLAIQIPSGAKIIGTQLRNDTAIAGLDDATELTPITTYSAIYATGATQTINATIALTANIKTNTFFNVNAATDITSAATDITLDAGSGNKFTAGGIISAVTYYYELTSITSL
jgi:hypothetical protein